MHLTRPGLDRVVQSSLLHQINRRPLLPGITSIDRPGQHLDGRQSLDRIGSPPTTRTMQRVGYGDRPTAQWSGSVGTIGCISGHPAVVAGDMRGGQMRPPCCGRLVMNRARSRQGALGSESDTGSGPQLTAPARTQINKSSADPAGRKAEAGHQDTFTLAGCLGAVQWHWVGSGHVNPHSIYSLIQSV
jgi:hypothetical protein